MSYYTTYELSYNRSIVKESKEDISGYYCLEYVKWYEHEEDMKEFSKKYPMELFTLEGVGEEEGDMWIKWFKNGVMQESKAKIKISYDECVL